MVIRTQLDRLAARIEALVANTTGHLVVVDRDETPEQALHRQGLSLTGSYPFVHTGVPRLPVRATNRPDRSAHRSVGAANPAGWSSPWRRVPDAGPNGRGARKAHAARYPEDDVGTMMVIGWQPMTSAEWIAKYGASTVQD